LPEAPLPISDSMYHVPHRGSCTERLLSEEMPFKELLFRELLLEGGVFEEFLFAERLFFLTDISIILLLFCPKQYGYLQLKRTNKTKYA
jgi:hypothetical protein